MVNYLYDLEEIENAEADFVTFGPVYPTPGKGDPVGMEALKAACRLGKPVLALGGVTLENAAECVRAGAAGVAGIRLFQQNEVARVVSKLRAGK